MCNMLCNSKSQCIINNKTPIAPKSLETKLSGAECNGIPVHVYKQATGDVMLGNVKLSDNTIVTSGGTT